MPPGGCGAPTRHSLSLQSDPRLLFETSEKSHDANDGPEGGRQMGISAKEPAALGAFQGEMIAPSRQKPQRVMGCELTRTPFPLWVF